MKQVTLTIHRVFDLQRYPAGRTQRQHTRFSFSSDSGTHHDVSIYGWPEIEPGMTVTAILDDPLNWQTLVAWVNHGTLEIAVPDLKLTKGITMSAAVSALIFFLVLFGIGRGLSDLLRIVGFVVLGLFVSLSAYGLMQWHKQKQLLKHLENQVRRVRHMAQSRGDMAN